MTDTDDTNRVSPNAACPICGERDIDRLVWVDDDWVRCTTCGIQYDPLAGHTRKGPAHDDHA